MCPPQHIWNIPKQSGTNWAPRKHIWTQIWNASQNNWRQGWSWWASPFPPTDCAFCHNVSIYFHNLAIYLYNVAIYLYNVTIYFRQCVHIFPQFDHTFVQCDDRFVQCDLWFLQTLNAEHLCHLPNRLWLMYLWARETRVAQVLLFGDLHQSHIICTRMTLSAPESLYLHLHLGICTSWILTQVGWMAQNCWNVSVGYTCWIGISTTHHLPIHPKAISVWWHP